MVCLVMGFLRVKYAHYEYLWLIIRYIMGLLLSDYFFNFFNFQSPKFCNHFSALILVYLRYSDQKGDNQLIDSHAADVKNSLSAYSIGNETSIFEEKGMLHLKCH